MTRVTPTAHVGPVLGLCAVAFACGGESGFSGPPDDDGSDLKPGLTTAVRVEATASELSETLGWTGGVPGAEVRLHRLGTDFAWETAMTDATGVARFPDVIRGDYRVAAYRPLTEDEEDDVGQAAWAFGDGFLAAVHEGSEASLSLTPTRVGSVVFSEIYATSPTVAEVNYDFHMFFELSNNSDQTVFLDGMIFGTTLGVANIDNGAGSCAIQDRYRTDPTGIWAHFLHQFPGSGTEHPLAPAATTVVALDAVDHSNFDPRFPDLSGAAFELEGTGDPDNPNAVNLPEVGVRPFMLGHGLRFFVNHTLFLAAPLDVDALEREVKRIPNSQDVELIKIPASAIVDVVATEDDDAFEEQQYTRCGDRVARNFDRLEGGFIEHGVDLGLSVQRLADGELGGHVVLQDTNTSAVDLVKRPYTPGRLP